MGGASSLSRPNQPLQQTRHVVFGTKSFLGGGLLSLIVELNRFAVAYRRGFYPPCLVAKEGPPGPAGTADRILLD